ncbi:response regulator [Geomonas sp.]|uniref:response regulator n=1 Tax=Geomonas sp. TaxID=2651584 RepID=UPI002B4931DE|nr:response regulator [Geomonas sp.]HJV35217.1 response regulator [Geomonas sp.]
MKKVLVIDDSKFITELYSQFLTSRGYQVESLNSPFGVTTNINKNKPDVVLLDLNMPGLSGKGILELLKGHRSSRIIVVSADTREEEMKGLSESGLADDYFIKGQDLNYLDHKIRKVMV